MKQKTSKLRKLEANRYSILTDKLNRCFLCRREGQMDMHEIWGGSNRKMSMLHGFCVPLCRECHMKITNNAEMSRQLKADCQKFYELTHTRNEFLNIIGKSYR